MLLIVEWSDTTVGCVMTVVQAFTPERCRRRARRPRVDYSDEEVEHLLRGVARYGHTWDRILRKFRFHAQRTPQDLKEKYGRIRQNVCMI